MKRIWVFYLIQKLFQKKIEFKSEVDENQMFDEFQIFNLLIEKINDEKSN